MADDPNSQQPPADDQSSSGTGLIHSVLGVLHSVGHSMGEMVGGVRAARDREARWALGEIEKNPDLLKNKDFHTAAKRITGLDDEALDAWSARSHIGMITSQIADMFGINKEKARDPYDQAMLDQGRGNAENVNALRQRGQIVPKSGGDIIQEANRMMPPGAQLDVQDPMKTTNLRLGQGTGAMARLQQQAQLTKLFTDAFDAYKGRGVGDAEAATAAGRYVTDYAAARGLSLPDIITKAATYDARKGQAGGLQTIMAQARKDVELNMATPIAEATAAGRGGATGPGGAQAATTGATHPIQIGSRFYNVPIQTEEGKDPTPEQQQQAVDAYLANPDNIKNTQGYKTKEEAAAAASAPAGKGGNRVIRLAAEKKAAETSAVEKAKVESHDDFRLDQAGPDRKPLTVLYGQNSPDSGTNMPSDMRLGDAKAKGGVILSPKAAANFPQLEQATKFFLKWPEAANILFSGGKGNEFIRSATYAAAEKVLGTAGGSAAGGTLQAALKSGLIPPAPGEQNTASGRSASAKKYLAAITTMQELRNNLIIMLRSGMGERGNFAKAIVDKALKSGPSVWDNATSANFRMRFMASMLAASKLTQGIPLTQDEMKAYQAIDREAASIGITSDPILSGLMESPQFKQLAEQVVSGLPGAKNPADETPDQKMERLIRTHTTQPGQ